MPSIQQLLKPNYAIRNAQKTSSLKNTLHNGLHFSFENSHDSAYPEKIKPHYDEFQVEYWTSFEKKEFILLVKTNGAVPEPSEEIQAGSKCLVYP